MSAPKPLVSVSIVSHGQTGMVKRLFEKIEQYPSDVNLEVILTENIPTEHPIPSDPWPFALKTIDNPAPCGLAANHNQAFKAAKGTFFALVNPDVVFVEDVFSQLIADIEDGSGDITAPLIVNSSGEIQDSFRPLPTPMSLVRRLIQVNNHQLSPVSKTMIYPDWIAGIFLCMRSQTFQQLGGMDEQYYLYFEDVDFCCRARLANLKPVIDTRVQAMHEAGRQSRKNYRYTILHLRSAIRFFFSNTYREARKL
jgi:GT2 family glycosyltransferase